MMERMELTMINVLTTARLLFVVMVSTRRIMERG